MTDAASSANSTAPNEPARVLVADDDRAIRESLERVLSLEGYGWPRWPTAPRRWSRPGRCPRTSWCST